MCATFYLAQRVDALPRRQTSQEKKQDEGLVVSVIRTKPLPSLSVEQTSQESHLGVCK